MITTTNQLVARAMAAADMHDTFATPAQWMYWATQEHLALAIFLARASWTQNVVTQTITVTGSENGVFPLSAMPLAIVALHQVGPQGMRLVSHNNAVDFLRQLPGSTVVTRGDVVEYRTLWDQANDRLVLNFFPEPRVGDTYVVSYIPHPARLVLDSPGVGEASSVAYPLGFEERIVLGMARRALAKEESDTSEVMRQMREVEQVIEEACWSRVMSEVPTVRNTDGNRPGSWSRTILYPPSGSWVWV